MSLAMSLRARGPVGSAVRTVNVLSRFGASVAAMERRLDLYESITVDLGIHPTWPATACVLGRHPALLRRYAERGAELTVHGLVHGDHSRLGARLQRDTLSRATEIFERAGLRPKGFRGPYLRYNAETLDVLRELEFWYHSSQAVVFPLVDAVQPTPAASGRFALACELYSAIDARTIAVTPRLREGLVDIPVAIPDDEILVERLGVNVATATAQWLQILDDTYRRGELFTVQLHPERIIELGDALGATCVEARRRSPAVYIARLDEIAAWWLRRSRFTGATPSAVRGTSRWPHRARRSWGSRRARPSGSATSCARRGCPSRSRTGGSRTARTSMRPALAGPKHGSSRRSRPRRGRWSGSGAGPIPRGARSR